MRIPFWLGSLPFTQQALTPLVPLPTGGITADTVKKVQAAAGKLDAAQKKFGELYIKAAEKVVAKGAGYVDTELARLEKIIDGGNVTPDKKAAFLIKANVLKAFKGEPTKDVTEEL